MTNPIAVIVLPFLRRVAMRFGYAHDLCNLPTNFNGKSRKIRSPRLIAFGLVVAIAFSTLLVLHSIGHENISVFTQTNGAHGKASAIFHKLISFKLLELGDAISLLVGSLGLALIRAQFVIARCPNLVFDKVVIRSNGELKVDIIVATYGFTRIVSVFYFYANQCHSLPQVTNKTIELDHRQLKEKLQSNPKVRGVLVRRCVNGAIMPSERTSVLSYVTEEESDGTVGFRFVVEGEYGDVFYRDYFCFIRDMQFHV